MRRLALPPLLLLALSAAAPLTSAYTSLDLDRCTQLDRGEAPQSAEWRCAGYRGIPLFVQSGDERYDVDAGAEDRDELWADMFDYPGKTVEWRLWRGKPVAIIYRLLPANPEAGAVSMLVVETVGTKAKPGCRVGTIRGSEPNANARARRLADRVARERLPCLKPR